MPVRFFELLAELQANTPADAEFLYDARTAEGSQRLTNLRRYLELTESATTLLVGEAPGWRGATVTGVPFMSVRELGARPGLLSGDPDGDGFEMPSDPAAPWERSAAVVQSVCRSWAVQPLHWPIFPDHPFRAPDRSTNRPPRVSEVRAGTPIAEELVRWRGIRRVIAVGRKAEQALAEAGIPATTVRHPARGGASLFAAQMAELGRVAS